MKRVLIMTVFLLLAVSATAEERRFSIPLQGSPSLGPADAPVTLVEFIDFQ